MLTLNGETFASGRVKFLDQTPAENPATPKIYVPIRPADLGATLLALLDTGSAWSILQADVAAEIGLFDRDGNPMTMKTRLGEYRGKLVRTVITLLAEEGQSLEVDATVFVSTEWTAGNFIGYAGLLERVHIALEPERNNFYFGSSA